MSWYYFSFCLRVSFLVTSCFRLFSITFLSCHLLLLVSLATLLSFLLLSFLVSRRCYFAFFLGVTLLFFLFLFSFLVSLGFCSWCHFALVSQCFHCWVSRFFLGHFALGVTLLSFLASTLLSFLVFLSWCHFALFLVSLCFHCWCHVAFFFGFFLGVTLLVSQRKQSHIKKESNVTPKKKATRHQKRKQRDSKKESNVTQERKQRDTRKKAK